MVDLSRLLSASTIAVIGGGVWCESIIKAAQLIGYDGQIFPVHPGGKEIAGLQSYKTLSDWHGPIDAAFVGVNRKATLDVVAELAELKAGGAICFASGFLEAISEDSSGSDLQADLVASAGEMPILGPNCYGFINALDRVSVWPDQHGLRPVESGVAILTQSSNIAINLTMQQRALPIAHMVTCGNQAQTSQAQIARHLLDDPRITAIGVHIEGFGDVQDWYRFARAAHEKGVPVVAIKVGKSQEAQRATISHTASLAGNDTGAAALLDHLGIGRAEDIPTFLEALKLFHAVGKLDAPTLSAISCSGGEASLVADTAMGTGLSFPPLRESQKKALSKALGPMVALANPLDYHTYVWRDTEAMTAAWTPMADEHIGMTFSIVDYPHTDATDWACATQAALNVKKNTGHPMAVVATLPELMPMEVAQELMSGGVVPMYGLREAVEAVRIAALTPEIAPLAPVPGGEVEARTILSEAEAKFELSEFDLDLPRRVEATLDDLLERATGLMPPLVLKGLGIAHKTEAGAVVVGLQAEDLETAASAMPTDRFLVEEMIGDGIAELLVGVTRDPAHGMVLTVGAGGILTEVMRDRVSLLLPTTEHAVEKALAKLKVSKLLGGFRGNPPASLPSIVSAIMAVQNYVLQHQATLDEVEINPLICTPTRAVAVDALIRKV